MNSNGNAAIQVLKLEQAMSGASWTTFGSPLQTGALTNIGVANLPDGGLYMYGINAQDELVLVGMLNGSFVSTIAPLSISGTVSSVSFVFTTNTSWSLLALATPTGGSATATFVEGSITSNGTNLILSVGASGQLSTLPTNVTTTDILVGYYDGLAKVSIFAIQGSDGNFYYTGASGNAVPFTFANLPSGTVFTSASVQETPNGLRLFLVDNANRLWSIIQNPNSTTVVGWLPALNIAQNVAQVGVNQSPELGLSVATVAATDNSVAIWSCANTGGLWRCDQVATAEAEAYTMPRYRIEFQVLDQTGSVVPGTYQLALAGNATPTPVSIGGQSLLLTTTPVSVQTDPFGYITVCIQATTSIAAPSLVLSGTGVTALTANPAQAISTYLSGNGPLNYGNASGALPTFDSQGATLTSATVGTPTAYLAPGLHPTTGSPNPQLAPTVATAITNLAVLSVNPSAGSSLQQNNPANPASAPTTLTTAAQVQQAVASLNSSASSNNGGFFSDLESWASDAWQHLKSGLADVGGWVLDAANAVCHFLVDLGNDLKSVWSLVVSGAEDIGHAIESALQWVETEVTDLIDWLKAIFDWSAIWQGKQAIEAYISQGMTNVQTYLAQMQTSVIADIDSLQGNIDSLLSNLQSTLAGATGTGAAAVGSPPSKPSNVTSSSSVTSPHARWFTERVTSSNPTMAVPTMSQDLQNAAAALGTACTSAETALSDALDQMYTAVSTLFSGGASAGSYTLSALVGVVTDVVNAIFDIVKGIVAALFDVTEAAVSVAQTSLATPIDCALLQALWAWMAEEAGYPNDTAFTPQAVLSLVIALPTVVVYRIFEGTTSSPFSSATSGSQNANTQQLLAKPPTTTMLAMSSPQPSKPAEPHPDEKIGPIAAVTLASVPAASAQIGVSQPAELSQAGAQGAGAGTGDGDTAVYDWVFLCTSFIPVIQMIPDASSLFSVAGFVRNFTLAGIYDFSNDDSTAFKEEIAGFGIVICSLMAGVSVYVNYFEGDAEKALGTVFGRSARSIFQGLCGVVKLIKNISAWDDNASDELKAFAIMDPLGDIMMFARASQQLQNSEFYLIPFTIAFLCDFEAPYLLAINDGVITPTPVSTV